jgi:hypothetical protein
MKTAITVLEIESNRASTEYFRLVGLRIHNTENLENRVTGISLRRREQPKPDVVWSVLEKVIQSNARFGLTDQTDVRLNHV